MYMLIRYEEGEMYTKTYKTLEEAQGKMLDEVREYYNEEEVYIGIDVNECTVGPTDAIVYCGIYVRWKIAKCDKPE